MTFRLSWAPDLDLGSGHGHYPFFISHRVLPVYQISSKSKKLFVDGRTDGNLPPIVLGRLPKFGKSRPNNTKNAGYFPQDKYIGNRVCQITLLRRLDHQLTISVWRMLLVHDYWSRHYGFIKYWYAVLELLEEGKDRGGGEWLTWTNVLSHVWVSHWHLHVFNEFIPAVVEPVSYTHLTLPTIYSV